MEFDEGCDEGNVNLGENENREVVMDVGAGPPSKIYKSPAALSSAQ
jgi:hypothetical protein